MLTKDLRSTLQTKLYLNKLTFLESDEEFWYITGQCLRCLNIQLSKDKVVPLKQNRIETVLQESDCLKITEMLIRMLKETKAFKINSLLKSVAMHIEYATEYEIKEVNTYLLLKGYNSKLILI